MRRSGEKYVRGWSSVFHVFESYGKFFFFKKILKNSDLRIWRAEWLNSSKIFGGPGPRFLSEIGAARKKADFFKNKNLKNK